MKRLAPLLAGLCLLMALFATPAAAQEVPPLPHAFYGTVEINDNPAPAGIEVEASCEGVLTTDDNPITVTEAGEYGGPGGLDPKLIVQGDILEGATITFYIHGVQAEQTWEWHSGDVTELNLSVTVAQLTAEAGGPYSGRRGASIDLSGSASGGIPTYTFAWDLDNDGAYDDATGATPSHSWGASGTYTIGLQVTDSASLMATDTATVTVTAPEPSSTGGGGGVGVPTYYTDTNLFGTEKNYRIDSDGEILATITATSADGNLTVTIPKGTIALGKDGKRLRSLQTAIDETPPSAPEDCCIIGLVYDLGPEGATFDPAITLAWSYDPDALPEDVAEEDLVVAYYDEDVGTWVEVDCVVDTENDTITASVEHFTTFAIIGAVTPPPEEEEVVVVPAPAAFLVSNLTVTPLEVEPKEAVTITVSVANTGGTEGSYRVVLKVNGVKEAEKTATIAAGSSLDVSFRVTKEDAGSYSVTVDGLSASFTVAAPPPPPPPPPEEEELVPEVPAPINWPLIGGIIAAVVVVALLIFFLVVRRRAA